MVSMNNQFLDTLDFLHVIVSRVLCSCLHKTMVLQHNRMNENGMAASSDIAVSNLLLWDVIYLRTAVLFGPFIHIDYVSYTSKKSCLCMYTQVLESTALSSNGYRNSMVFICVRNCSLI